MPEVCQRHTRGHMQVRPASAGTSLNVDINILDIFMILIPPKCLFIILFMTHTSHHKYYCLLKISLL